MTCCERTMPRYFFVSAKADDSRPLRAFVPALVLLAILASINYIDRSNLSIAAPRLKDELRISGSQLGILLSAFFWTYTAMQFVSGWVVDRLDVNCQDLSTIYCRQRSTLGRLTFCLKNGEHLIFLPFICSISC